MATYITSNQFYTNIKPQKYFTNLNCVSERQSIYNRLCPELQTNPQPFPSHNSPAEVLIVLHLHNFCACSLESVPAGLQPLPVQH